MKKIEKVTILGSGTMGSAIAAHLVNGGFRDVYLLDILPKLTDKQIAKGYTLEDKNVRNFLARKNLNTVIADKKMPQFGSKKFAKHVTIGNTTDDFDRYVSESDWIIEVVPEVAKIKQNTFKNIDKVRKPDSIVTSNTSGISINDMVGDCSDSLKENFFVTHFFNPVRFMKLLEIVKGDQTKPEVIETITKLGEDRLGKGIVHGYDVPGFVGNRIGCFFLMYTLNLLKDHDLEKINSVFEKKLGYGGKPFSTCDLVGIDVACHVMDNIYENTNDECHELFKVPKFVRKMIKQELWGRKKGAGFFKRIKEGDKKIDLVIDPKTLEYSPRKKPKLDSVGEARKARSLEEAVSKMYTADDEGGEIYRKMVNNAIRYAFARAPEISPEGIEGIDKAMQWGYNQVGPGKILDIIGVDNVINSIEKKSEVPQLLKDLKRRKIYTQNYSGEEFVFDGKKGYKKIERPEKYSNFKEIAKTRNPIFEIRKGGRAFDIGDDVIALEMLSKRGTINMELIDATYKALELAEKEGRGLIIGNDLEDFSLGADVDMMLGYILRGKTDLIREVVKRFQMLNQKLKFAKVPVVVVKKGMAFGGGCELGYGAHIRAAHDSYIGLVEFGVGLIPAGGGVKETLIRKYKKHAKREGSKPLDYIQESMMQILNPLEFVSASAHMAKELGYMSETDGISMNSDFLLYDAKNDIMKLSENYEPPKETYVHLPGRDMKYTLNTGIDLFLAGKHLPIKGIPKLVKPVMEPLITAQFELVMKTLADVVSGGDDVLPPGRKFSEEELLEKEREGFLRLTTEMSCKEKFSWLNITANQLKKNRTMIQPYMWAMMGVKNSYFNKKIPKLIKKYQQGG